MQASQMKTYLRQLHAERALAAIEGLSANGSYMADLDEEIAAASDAYVCAALTEIAVFRGELYGRLQG